MGAEAPRAEGIMNSWRARLNLVDVFHDENRSFEERRDEIVKRMRKLPNLDEWQVEITDNLADAPDIPTFDSWWDAFYDWADDNRVWVATRF